MNTDTLTVRICISRSGVQVSRTHVAARGDLVEGVAEAGSKAVRAFARKLLLPQISKLKGSKK